MRAPRRDRVRTEATRLLKAGVTGQVFPGASSCTSWREGGEGVFIEAFAGRVSDGGATVEAATPYDLASITKPIVAVAALRMVAAGKITLDTRADAILADVRGGQAGPATLEQLLTHRSGLAPWGGLYLDVPHESGSAAARRWIIGEASRRSDESGATGAVYSDLGYIIAGEMIARVWGDSLDRVVAAEVTEPLGISDELFYAGGLPAEKRAAFLKKVAPTERCEWRGKVVRGEVHDENCAALGGVAGHAGLFGTARALPNLGRAMLDVLAGRGDFLPKKMLIDSLAPRDGSGTHRIGWDAKGPDGAGGKRLSTNAFGHLGFTGTSLWCDPPRDVVLVLLTNRIHPSRANEKIKGFRPAFHDGVLAAYD